MVGEPSAPAASCDWKRPALIGWAALMALLWFVWGSKVAPLAFSDPDDQLRLIQVRDLLAGQGWWDLVQRRIDPPQGVLMHWSRLVDLPIAATILLLKPFLGAHGAEVAAIAIIPALTALCAVLLLARLASRLVSRPALIAALIALLVALPLIVQLRPTRIDHHGWQVVALLAALGGLFARDPRRGGLVSGLALAAWLSISMEGLPLAAALFAVMALRWLRDPQEGPRFVAAIQALALGSLALAFVSRNPLDLATYCDSISPMHLAVFAWCGFATTVLARLPLSPLRVLAGLGAIGAGGLAIMLAWAPECTAGGFGALGPELERLWYREVIEGQPVWHNRLPVTLQFVVPSLAGLLAAAAFAWRSTGEERLRWTDFTLVLLACVASGLLVSRTSAYGAALAVIPLGAAFVAAHRAVRARASAAGRLTGLLALAASTVLVLAPAVPVFAIANLRGEGQRYAGEAQLASCRFDPALPALRALPRGRIFAHLNIGPQLMLFTDHSVTATAHHRAPAAMLDVFQTLLGSPEAAQAVMERREIDYVVLCPGLPEIDRVVREAPDGLAARLRDGKTPDWLEPIALPAETGIRAWRVKRQG